MSGSANVPTLAQQVVLISVVGALLLVSPPIGAQGLEPTDADVKEVLQRNLEGLGVRRGVLTPGAAEPGETR